MTSSTPAAAPAPAPARQPDAGPRRPRLAPAVRRLWRDPQTLQLGLAPGRAVVLAGVDEGVRAALGLLDGRPAPSWTVDAAARGCAPARSGELLGLLCRAGLVEDAASPPAALPGASRADRDRLAPDAASLGLLAGGAPAVPLERRALAEVLVVGAGRVGAPLAVLLAAAGVGGIAVEDGGLVTAADVGTGGLLPEDVGQPRDRAVVRRVHAVAPGARCSSGALPDLVVLAPAGALDGERTRDLVRAGTPHLPALVREQVGTVGPLVLPGRSACLRCLDLTRTDLDPGWPSLAVQLERPGPGPGACDAALALAVAALAAQQVLAAVDQLVRPATVGGTLETVLPDWRWRRRSWALHPDCGCAPDGPPPPPPASGRPSRAAAGRAGSAPPRPDGRPRPAPRTLAG